MSYTNTATIKKYLGVNFTSSLDSYVDGVIDSIVEYIERYCGDDRFGKRIFEAPDSDDDVTYLFNGNGAERLYIGDLRSITTLSVDDVELTINEDFFAYPLNITEGEEPYQYLELAQPATRLNSNSRQSTLAPYIFEKAQANVEVVGKFRYSDTVPSDVSLAATKLVGAVLKENISDNDVKEIKAEQLGDFKVTFQEIGKIAHSLKITDLLDPYKRNVKFGSVGVVKVS